MESDLLWVFPLQYLFYEFIYFLRIKIIINNPFTGHYSKHTATQPLINSSDK